MNEVYIKESPPSCFKINEPNVTNGGVLVKRCGLSFEELCKYKYLLNVGSNGYANKLKYLFLTGSVVIWVKKDSLNYEVRESCRLLPFLRSAGLVLAWLCLPSALADGAMLSHLLCMCRSSLSISSFRMSITSAWRQLWRCPI